VADENTIRQKIPAEADVVIIGRLIILDIQVFQNVDFRQYFKFAKIL
jgi:hypothetical protein